MIGCQNEIIVLQILIYLLVWCTARSRTGSISFCNIYKLKCIYKYNGVSTQTEIIVQIYICWSGVHSTGVEGELVSLFFFVIFTNKNAFMIVGC